MEAETLERVKKLGYNSLSRKHDFKIATAKDEDIMQLLSYLISLYEPTMVFEEKNSLNLVQKKLMRVMDLTHKFASNERAEPLKYRNKIVPCIMAIIDKIEWKYGDAVYTSTGRPRVGPARFNFAEKDENMSTTNVREEKAADKVETKSESTSKTNVKPVLKPDTKSRRSSMAPPSLETIPESHLESVVSPPKKPTVKAMKDKSTLKKTESVFTSEAPEVLTGFSTGRQLMRTPTKSTTTGDFATSSRESDFKIAAVFINNSPQINVKNDKHTSPVLEMPKAKEKETKKKVEVMKPESIKEVSVEKLDAPSPFMIRKSKLQRTPIGGSTSLTPLSSKTYSPISHEEELIDTSDAPAVRSVRKEAKEERMSVKKEDKNADRWLSKATRARMASKAARALEAIIRTEEADVLSDYEFERKLHKSVKKASKIKSPKSSKKSKKSRVSMDQQQEVVAPVITTVQNFNVNPLVLPTLSTSVSNEEAAKWAIFCTQLPIPSQMQMHSVFAQMSRTGKSQVECDKAMYSMMQTYFPFLFTGSTSQGNSAPNSSSVSDDLVKPENPVQEIVEVSEVSACIEYPTEAAPAVLTPSKNLEKMLDLVVFEPAIIDAIEFKEEDKCDEPEKPTEKHVEHKMLSSPVNLAPSHIVHEILSNHCPDSTDLTDMSFQARVSRVVSAQPRKAQSLIKDLKNETNLVASARVPLAELDRQLSVDSKINHEMMDLFEAAMNDSKDSSSINDKLALMFQDLSEKESSAKQESILDQYNMWKSLYGNRKLSIANKKEFVESKFKKLQSQIEAAGKLRKDDFEKLQRYNQKLDLVSNNLLSKHKSPARSPARLLSDDAAAAETKQSLRRVQLFLEKRKNSKSDS